jgi:putative NADH-flavin reductase
MKSILAHIRRERRVVEQKLSKLKKDLSDLDEASRVLKDVERKVIRSAKKHSAEARRKMSLAAKRRWKKIKKGATRS